MEDQKNKSAIEMWASDDYSMRVENPMWREWKQKREQNLARLEYNKTAELPTWMSEETFLAMKELQREDNKKPKINILKRIFNFIIK